MRLLIRLIVVWLVLFPLTIYFGFPYVQNLLQEEISNEAHAQCMAQTLDAPTLFPPKHPAIAEGYCRCVREGATLTRADVFMLLQQREPVAMRARLDQTVEACSDRLMNPGENDAQVISF